MREKDGELAAARAARRRALLPMVAAAAGAAERRVSQEVGASMQLACRPEHTHGHAAREDLKAYRQRELRPASCKQQALCCAAAAARLLKSVCKQQACHIVPGSLAMGHPISLLQRM